MKLKDFVFNSLRVRGKKKKAASSGTVAATDISNGCFGLDKNRNWFPSANSRRRSHGSRCGSDDLIDANWQGNALYQSLGVTEDVKENCPLLALDSSLRDHARLSYSEMGTSSPFTGFDRNLDNSCSHDIVSENCGSVSSMSPLSEAETEYSIHEQNYSYHYHHERYNLHTEHNYRNKQRKTLLQKHHQSIDNVQQLVSKSSQNYQKPESGFFRKSLTSFKNLRKDSSKTKLLSSKQIEHAQLPADTSENKLPVHKMSTKIKHRGSKLFTKSKESKDVKYSTENFENQWAMEGATHNDLKSTKLGMDPFISTCMLYDKPYVRDNSVESCPPRHYGFQDELRDFDFNGFELASVSGYESDISRSRGRKARSRIKTNPWLPSPQLSVASHWKEHQALESRENIPQLSVASRWKEHQALESKENIPQLSVASRWKEHQALESRENIPLLEGDWGFSQSDQLEYHECGLQSFQAYPTVDSRGCHRKISSRKSPTGFRMASNLTTSSPYSVTKRTQDLPSSSFVSWDTSSSRTSSLNDLSNNVHTVKETAQFSPNAEFSLLADNIEQLATNISFEYDNTFDTTMESVSAGKETSNEMCTDDENNQIPQQKVGLRSRVNMTHSPDSGVGGLGGSDVDSTLTPNTQKEAAEMSIEYSMSSSPLVTSGTAMREVPDDNCRSEQRKALRVHSSRDAMKPECFINLNEGNDSSPWRMSITGDTGQSNGRNVNYYPLEENCQFAMSDSLYESKTRRQDTFITSLRDTHGGWMSFNEKMSTTMDGQASHGEATELNEKERQIANIQTQDSTLFGSNMEVGNEVLSRTDSTAVAHAVKRAQENTTDIDKPPTAQTKRPTGLHTKPHMLLNNMEKSTDDREQQRSWMDEFDCPRNITASESLESPTENWQWDYQFTMYDNLDAGSPGDRLCRVVLDDSEETKGDMLAIGSQNVDVGKLIVLLEGHDGKINLQQEINKAASINNSLDKINLEKLEHPSLVDFEMNDACVQTDFDEDLSVFGELNSTEDIEEGCMIFSQGSHAWQLRDNVPVNSWSGNKSQERDSEPIHNEGVCARAVFEQSDNLCSQEWTPHCELCHSEWKTGLCSDTQSHTIVSVELPVKKDTKLRHDEVTKQLSPKMPTAEIQSDFQSTQKPLIHSSTNAVNIPASCNEFLLGHILNCDSQKNKERKELYGSETIVVLSDSNSSSSEVVRRESVCLDRSGNSNVNHEGKSFIATDNAQYLGSTSASTTGPNASVNGIKSSNRCLNLERMAELRHIDANGNFLCNRSKLKGPNESLQRFPASEEDNFGDFLITPFIANKAEYLTFEDDSLLSQSLVGGSSLCRALGKRSPCAAPDASPQSRSRFEQLNSCIFNHSCDVEPFASWISPLSSPLLTSSWATNCTDLHQFEKNNRILIQNNENIIHSPTHSQLQRRSSTAKNSLHILNDETDNAKSFSSANQTSRERSEIFPNSVYSFAKCHTYTQHQDSTQSPILRTMSYSTASCATKHSKSRVPSTPLGTQPADDRQRLAEKVISLCQEKDLIFQKIYQAKQEEVNRKEHRLQIQRKMQAQTREALLQPLIDLRNKLEEQSRRLSEKCNINKNPNSPFRLL